jgi:hypothetical protein
LVFLGEVCGENLLSTPPGPLPSGQAPPLGGHVLWLGAQARWHWPPPEDWSSLEIDPLVSGEGRRLTLQHAWRDRRFGPLTRSYHWDGAQLVCSAFWADERARHAVHILQVPKDCLVVAKPAPDLARGYARFEGYDLDLDPSAEGGVNLRDEVLEFRYTGVSAKFALPSQTLRAVRGRFALELRPCPGLAPSQDLPDLGLVTQIWRGDEKLPFLEIEQLSAFHRVSNGRESSVRLVPSRVVEGGISQPAMVRQRRF